MAKAYAKVTIQSSFQTSTGEHVRAKCNKSLDLVQGGPNDGLDAMQSAVLVAMESALESAVGLRVAARIAVKMAESLMNAIEEFKEEDEENG